MPYLFHRVGNHLSDLVRACRNRSYTRDLILALYLLGHLYESFNSLLGSLLHSASQSNGICTCGKILQTLVNHCLSKNCCCSSSVTGNIICLCSYFLYELGTHVLKGILELDLLCDGHAVVCDERRAIGLVKNYIAAFRSKSHANCVRKLINAPFE